MKKIMVCGLGAISRFCKKTVSNATFTILFMLTFLMGITGCRTNDGIRPGDYGSGPRKAVPAEVVGEWMLTSVSSTNVVSRNGHTVPAWAFGSLYHINADGTGFSIVTASTNTYTSEDTQRVEENGTYEIELADDGEMVFKFYPANGKVYNNDIFAHDMDPAKLYPQTYINWVCNVVTSEAKTYFEKDDLRYYKTK